MVFWFMASGLFMEYINSKVELITFLFVDILHSACGFTSNCNNMETSPSEYRTTEGIRDNILLEFKLLNHFV